MSLTLIWISPLYKIWYYNYATLLKQCIWSLVTLYCTPIYRLTERKKPFPCTKLSMQNGRCKLGYVLGLLVQGKVTVEFGRKLFLVDCLLWKTLNIMKISITERAQALSCTRKLFSVTIQGNITAMRYRWRHLVGSSFSYPYQSQYDGTGLCIMSRG